MTSELTWEELVELNASEDEGVSWKPTKDPGQPRTLVGTVKGYDRAHTEFNGVRPWICKLVDRSGVLWSVWLFGQVLVEEFDEKRPLPGERVVLRYCGQSKNPKPGQNPAHIYRLTIGRDMALPAFLDMPRLPSGDPVDAQEAIDATVEDAEPAEEVEEVEEVDATQPAESAQGFAAAVRAAAESEPDDDDAIPF